MRSRLAFSLAMAALLGCRVPPGLAALLNVNGDGTTGLEGTVRRGPITPVCQVGVPCDAPFSAAFQVEQAQRVVATFQSDSAGHYQVLLAPGVYTVTPDSSAAVWPKGQVKQVTVGAAGMTHVDLEFDTGIR